MDLNTWLPRAGFFGAVRLFASITRPIAFSKGVGLKARPPRHVAFAPVSGAVEELPWLRQIGRRPDEPPADIVFAPIHGAVSSWILTVETVKEEIAGFPVEIRHSLAVWQ
jgi:hypothetical protein